MSLDPSDLAATAERPKNGRGARGKNNNGKPNQADVKEDSQPEAEQSAAAGEGPFVTGKEIRDLLSAMPPLFSKERRELMSPEDLKAADELAAAMAPMLTKHLAEAGLIGVSVSLPIHSCLPGYATKNIDFDASPRQAAAAKVLWSSLSADGARCFGAGGAHPDGKRVESVTMGIRWLLDQVADEIERTTGKKLTDDFGLSF